MLARRNDILASYSYAAPRAHLEGLTLPPGFQLPSLEAVLGDVETRELFLILMCALDGLLLRAVRSRRSADQRRACRRQRHVGLLKDGQDTHRR